MCCAHLAERGKNSVAMALSTKNLKDVLNLLFTISGKWNFIGIALGIDIEALNNIKRQHNNEPTHCLVAVITLWLRSIDPQPTWKILAHALRTKYLDEVALAEEGIAKLVA